MRVISQHGNVDLPYEQIVVCHAMESVIALYNGEKYVLGEYSSKEKSYKAMEMLRKVYENNVFYHCIASSKRFEEVQSILSEEQFRKATTEYFQFPQDDEIEVRVCQLKKSANAIDVESLLTTVCLNGLDILNMVSKKKIDCAFIQCFMVIQMAIHM